MAIRVGPVWAAGGRSDFYDLPAPVTLAAETRGPIPAEHAMTDVDVITRLLHSIDAADWDGVRAAFADPVATDYTSLWGGEPETLPVDTLVRRWQEFAGGFAATQHQTGPVVVVDGLAHTHVVANHWFAAADGGDTWTVHGHYAARISGGRIAELTLHTFHAAGHDGLPSIAGQRPAR
jgi:hypothetical protein